MSDQVGFEGNDEVRENKPAAGGTRRIQTGWPYVGHPPVSVTAPPDLKNALEVRDALEEELHEAGWSGEHFDGVDSREIAEWLMRTGWVKGMR
jgi:hypothetical protein